MDIRISSYQGAAQGISTTRFGATPAQPAAVAVSSAANNGPVDAIRALTGASTGTSQPAAQAQSTQPTDIQRLQANAEGRGKIIDIYA